MSAQSAARIVRSTYAIRILWTGVVVLALIGVLAAVGRAISTAQGRTDTVVLSRADEWSMRMTAEAAGMQPGTARYEHAITEGRRFLGTFYDHAVATWLHVAPAALFMLLAPFQFSRRIRARHIRVHRWSGRLIVGVAIPIGLSGLFFGLFVPYAGLLEITGVGLFGALFLFALGRAFLAIRRKDTVTHREWMIRMFAVALGVAMQRVLAVPAVAITRQGPEGWFGETIWLGFSLTVAAAELWIRATRARGTAEKGVAIPQGATLPTANRGVTNAATDRG